MYIMYIIMLCTLFHYFSEGSIWATDHRKVAFNTAKLMINITNKTKLHAKVSEGLIV